MRSRRERIVAVVVAGLALVAAACGETGEGPEAGDTSPQRGTITVGGFNFPESSILAEIYGGALRAKGYDVPVKRNLGSREVVEPALERGEIDLYPGYAATDLEFVNRGAREATNDARINVQRLRARLEPKGITVLDPSPAVDTNAFAVTRSTADRLNLRKLSDLAPVANRLVLGGPPECPSRPFCLPGLEQTYGLRFRAFKALDAGGPLSKSALEKGEVDVALIFSTDGEIGSRGFAVLEDDRRLQNADNVVPVVRIRTATPEVRDLLNRVSAALTTEDLVALNKRAVVDREDPDVIGDDWLREKGFMPR